MHKAAVLVLLIACGSILPAEYQPDQLPQLSDLTEEWGCGFGFYVSNPGQTATLRIVYTGTETPTAVELPHPDWEANVIQGTDLYANWCDDVIEEFEPQPVEHWKHPVVAGRLEILGDIPDPFSGSPLTLRATDLVVEVPSGETVPIGAIEIVNPNYGFMAG